MKKYNVEFLDTTQDNTLFDNWIGDYIEAEDKEEAIEMAKDWLLDNGIPEEDLEHIAIAIKEYRNN